MGDSDGIAELPVFSGSVGALVDSSTALLFVGSWVGATELWFCSAFVGLTVGSCTKLVLVGSHVGENDPPSTEDWSVGINVGSSVMLAFMVDAICVGVTVASLGEGM